MRTTILTLLIVACLGASAVMLADGASDGVRVAKELYERDRTRQQINELRQNGLQRLRSQLQTRSPLYTERRYRLYPCEYVGEGGKILPWGTDLIPPLAQWVTVTAATERANAKDAVQFVGFESRGCCWYLVVWHEEWRDVPVTQPINISQEMRALVVVPKTSEGG